MAADDPSGAGWTGGEWPAGSGQAAADAPGLPAHSLVLRLVIAETEPLSGLIGLEQNLDVRIDFSGWIGLMSAINELLAGQSSAADDQVP